MLKSRIIIVLTIKDGVLFRTKKFVPDYRYTQSYLATEAVDEVVIVDVGTDRKTFLDGVGVYIEKCFCPITLGGHLTTEADALDVLRLGADKALIQCRHLNLIEKLAEKVGRQFVVAGVDYRKERDASWMALAAESAGAGEILLTSVERDGSLEGYDIETLKRVVETISVPVVISGGCGNWGHMAEAFAAGASGCATTVIHHMTEPSLMAAKAYLREAGLPVRIAT